MKLTNEKYGDFTIAWLIVFSCFLTLSFILHWYDNFTILTPKNIDIETGYFVFAGTVGIVNAVIGWRLAKKRLLRVGTPPVVAALALFFVGLIFSFLAVLASGDFVQGMIYFPHSKTKSYQSVLKISRAYIMDGKNKSWIIQTMPDWTNIDISQEDYNYMLAHRRSDDKVNDTTDISSNGYFCANVTLEQAGSAIRVMHSGYEKLPKGSVTLCHMAHD